MAPERTGLRMYSSKSGLMTLLANQDERAWFRGPAVVAIHAAEEALVPDVPAVEKVRLT